MKLSHHGFVFPLGSLLRPRRQHDARKLRVRCAIAAPARDRCKCAKDGALHHQRRRTEYDDVAELPRTQRELQWIRHTLAVCIAEAREAEEGLYHMHEPLAWCYRNPHARITVACIPPVVPYAWLDDRRLALMKDVSLPFALHGQLTLNHGELLDKSGMTVLPHDP